MSSKLAGKIKDFEKQSSKNIAKQSKFIFNMNNSMNSGSMKICATISRNWIKT